MSVWGKELLGLRLVHFFFEGGQKATDASHSQKTRELHGLVPGHERHTHDFLGARRQGHNDARLELIGARIVLLNLTEVKLYDVKLKALGTAIGVRPQRHEEGRVGIAWGTPQELNPLGFV